MNADLSVPGRMPGLSSCDEEMPVVLGVNPSRAVQGRGSIGRAKGELLEDLLNQDTSLANRVKISIFAVGVDRSVRVHHGGIHAPFKSVGMVGNAGDGPIGIASAALRILVLEAPLDVEVGIELSDKERFRPQQLGAGTLCRTPVGVSAIGATRVVIIFEINQVGFVVGVDGRRVVPAEVERIQKITVRAEMEHVSLSEVIGGISALEKASIGGDAW